MITTDEIKAIPEWNDILKCINAAARDLKKEYPWSKVQLVTKRYKFLIVVDGEPVMEITAESLMNNKHDNHATT